MSEVDTKKELHKVADYISPEKSVVPCSKTTETLFGSGTMGGPDDVFEIMEKAKANYESCGNTKVAIVVSAENEPVVKVNNVYIGVEDDVDDINDMDGVQISKTLNRDDLTVFMSVCSIVEAGNKYCTPRQIHVVMTGRKESPLDSSDTTIKKIDAIMRKLLHTSIMLDWTEQAKAWGVDGDDVKEHMIESQLINGSREHIVFNNGIETTGYMILKTPDLLTYIKAIHQIAMVKREFLDIDITMSNRNIIIRDYIIKRIEQVKSNKKKKNRTSEYFRIDTLIEKCQLVVNNRPTEKKVRDTIYKILDCYVQNGYIKDYEKKLGKNGKTVESIKIVV